MSDLERIANNLKKIEEYCDNDYIRSAIKTLQDVERYGMNVDIVVIKRVVAETDAFIDKLEPASELIKPHSFYADEKLVFCRKIDNQLNDMVRQKRSGDGAIGRNRFKFDGETFLSIAGVMAAIGLLIWSIVSISNHGIDFSNTNQYGDTITMFFTGIVFSLCSMTAFIYKLAHKNKDKNPAAHVSTGADGVVIREIGSDFNKHKETNKPVFSVATVVCSVIVWVLIALLFCWLTVYAFAPKGSVTVIDAQERIAAVKAMRFAELRVFWMPITVLISFAVSVVFCVLFFAEKNRSERQLTQEIITMTPLRVFYGVFCVLCFIGFFFSRLYKGNKANDINITKLVEEENRRTRT
jgi:hypothetical protein